LKIIIVQLSDLHFSVEKWPDNPVLARASKVIAAIASLFAAGVDGCILLVNGDVAYAGLSAEYDFAEKFLTEIKVGLEGIFGKDKCFPILLPGNHDCNFKLDNDARRQLIAEPLLEGFGDGSVADICTKLQEDFFNFCQRFQGYLKPIVGMDRIFAEHRIPFGSEELVIRILNSAWCSRLNERPGSLVAPAAVLKPLFTMSGPASLVVTAFHHPYSWMEAVSARATRHIIESSSDLVFTGHEHVAETYAKTGFLGEHNEYIEAGPLQENGKPSDSEFNVVAVDTGRGSYVVNHFVWAEDLYETVTESIERPFIRNNARLQGEFQLNEVFRSELSDTDTVYQHPFKDTITLDDIYVYPDVREFVPLIATTLAKGPKVNSRDTNYSTKNDQSQPRASRRAIKGREIIDHVIGKRRVALSAPDRAGKTALARTLFKDLLRNGRMPLLVNGDEVDTRIANTLSSFLDKSYRTQYSGPKASKYWQLGIDDRALIIDDFDKLPNVRVVRESLLKEAAARFGTIVIIGGPALRFQELVSNDSEAALLGDYTHCEILGYGHKLRSQLIRRWFVMNRDGEIADDVVDQQLSQLEKIINIILGRDLLPPFPSYILLLLQALELRYPVDVTAASYGKLYQAFLTACLAKRKLDIETAFSYLSELAFVFFDRKIDCFDDVNALDWHANYVAEYKNPLDYAAVRDDLVAAGILVYRNGAVRFRVRAAYYFFTAQYISSHVDAAEMQVRVKDLAGKLYREDASNIILFLCHLNRDPVILSEVLSNANCLFADVPETDLNEDLRFTGELVARLHSPTLLHGNPEKRHQELLEAQDAAEVESDHTDEMYAYKREEETNEESEQRRQIAQINGSFKTIQILGQIARSFAGSLKGEQKRELAEACFGLGLRLLKFGFDAFRLSKEEYGTALQRRFRRRDSKLSEEKAGELANATVFMLVDMVTYGIIRHVAGSLGVERLSMTFKEIRDKRSSLAIRTLDAAIQLEHFANVPESLVIDLYQEFNGNILMESVVRHLAWDRLYYYRCPHDIAQRICEKVGIEMLSRTLDTDQKRT
jgi:hypothetical protein